MKFYATLLAVLVFVLEISLVTQRFDHVYTQMMAILNFNDKYLKQIEMLENDDEN